MQLVAELAQLSALKNQFLGMAAHDLRDPLAFNSWATSQRQILGRLDVGPGASFTIVFSPPDHGETA